MKFNEVMKDLFTADNSYYIAHCISSDCAMGGRNCPFNRKTI